MLILMNFCLGISDKALVDEQAFVSERISALNVNLVSLNPTGEVEEDDLDLDTFSVSVFYL